MAWGTVCQLFPALLGEAPEAQREPRNCFQASPLDVANFGPRKRFVAVGNRRWDLCLDGVEFPGWEGRDGGFQRRVLSPTPRCLYRGLFKRQCRHTITHTPLLHKICFLRAGKELLCWKCSSRGLNTKKAGEGEGEEEVGLRLVQASSFSSLQICIACSFNHCQLVLC